MTLNGAVGEWEHGYKKFRWKYDDGRGKKYFRALSTATSA